MNDKSTSQNGDVSTDSNTNQVLNGNAAPTENITGRGVFVVETVSVGIAVRTAFLAADGRLLDIPAVFPDLVYAMSQIDELKQIVAQRFAEAAQIGSQVIAQQIEANRLNAMAVANAAGNSATTAFDAAVTADAAPVKVETKTLKLNKDDKSVKSNA